MLSVPSGLISLISLPISCLSDLRSYNAEDRVPSGMNDWISSRFDFAVGCILLTAAEDQSGVRFDWQVEKDDKLIQSECTRK